MGTSTSNPPSAEEPVPIIFGAISEPPRIPASRGNFKLIRNVKRVSPQLAQQTVSQLNCRRTFSEASCASKRDNLPITSHICYDGLRLGSLWYT
jgi:hypothetical protein